jgi:MlaA lipoprotein
VLRLTTPIGGPLAWIAHRRLRRIAARRMREPFPQLAPARTRQGSADGIRSSFFNHDVLDHYLVKPVATGWDKVVPDVATYGLDRAFDLGTPKRLVNNLLYGAVRNGCLQRRRHSDRERGNGVARRVASGGGRVGRTMSGRVVPLAGAGVHLVERPPTAYRRVHGRAVEARA